MIVAEINDRSAYINTYRHKVWSSKVSDDTSRCGNSHVTNEWEKPPEKWAAWLIKLNFIAKTNRFWLDKHFVKPRDSFLFLWWLTFILLILGSWKPANLRQKRNRRPYDAMRIPLLPMIYVIPFHYWYLCHAIVARWRLKGTFRQIFGRIGLNSTIDVRHIGNSDAYG